MKDPISNSIVVLAVASLMAGPAAAGEITGNGKDIVVKGKSECAYSGINDTPEGDEMDPGGLVQSYGYFFNYVLRDAVPRPEKNGELFFLHPGNACNPG
ncbi:hypothetical protein [Sphingomicrobium marinum]|uniref:hypothetical protein n=1 Tax=Sphingomicrobium marinum TaxID=1227950 RepID=UPI00223FF08D|nr:hypothetical protein [Sphingomicrobium marinum]